MKSFQQINIKKQWILLVDWESKVGGSQKSPSFDLQEGGEEVYN